VPCGRGNAGRSNGRCPIPRVRFQSLRASLIESMPACRAAAQIATSCITNCGTRANIFWFGKKQNEAKCRRRINLLIKYNVNFLINSSCFLDATVGRTIGTKSQLVEVTSPYWLAAEALDENLRGEIGGGRDAQGRLRDNGRHSPLANCLTTHSPIEGFTAFAVARRLPDSGAGRASQFQAPLGRIRKVRTTTCSPENRRSRWP
jgi:hypothetical protein